MRSKQKLIEQQKTHYNTAAPLLTIHQLSIGLALSAFVSQSFATKFSEAMTKFCVVFYDAIDAYSSIPSYSIAIETWKIIPGKLK